MSTLPIRIVTEKAPAEQPEPLTVIKAARRLGVSRSQLYLMLERGDLPYHQVGKRRLLDPADVESYWQSCRVQHSQDCTSSQAVG